MRVFWIIFLPAAAYQLLFILASFKHLLRQRKPPDRSRHFQPPVSVLKPLHGLDPNTYEAFVSQVKQEYDEFEILFGVADGSDPAVPYVERLQAEFPSASVRLIIGREVLSNEKVGVLANLARNARYPVWVINDSDIKVTPEYLSQVVAPLVADAVGVVTCLYRVRAHTAPAAWEAIGIATDFMPSTLVAQLLGVREFGLGSTLAFRAADLERAGGFLAIGGYLADDYQLAKRITALGKRTLLSTYVVETALGDATWLGVWLHQVRWARTIRGSKGAGHAGLPITQAGLWILLGLLFGAQVPALVLLGLRFVSAALAVVVLRSSLTARLFWMAPLWDLYAFVVWLASYAGRTVRWRNRVFEIDKTGRIKS